MKTDESIAILAHACRYNPKALMARCAIEIIKMKDPQDLAAGLTVLGILARESARFTPTSSTTEL